MQQWLTSSWPAIYLVDAQEHLDAVPGHSATRVGSTQTGVERIVRARPGKRQVRDGGRDARGRVPWQARS